MPSNRKNYLIIGFLNIRSLNTGQDELHVTMDRHKPDLIALNETWIREGQEKYAPNILGYTLRNSPRPKDGRGGGVGFYIRRGLRAKGRKHPASELEQMWLEVTLPGSIRIAIGTAYRPDKSLTPSKAIDALSESVSAFSYCDHTIILTDFNVNLLEPGKKAAPELLSFMAQQNLYQLVHEPTRIIESNNRIKRIGDID